MPRLPWSAFLLVAIPATAQAQWANPDGWVAAGGRLVRPGDAPAPPGAIRPATASDWIGECESRFASANRQPGSGLQYESACRAWLDYYERTGATGQGYAFEYAIPVSVTTIEVPGDCPPPPVVRQAPAPHRHQARPHDKRVPSIRY